MDNVVELNTGKQLIITSRSAREVLLKPHFLSNIEEIKDKKGNIIHLSIDDYEISINSVIQLKLLQDKKIRPFKVAQIKKSKFTDRYVLFSTQLTKATRLIMPMLRLKQETQTSMKYNSNFINCYVGTKEEGYMNEIYLVYRYSGTIEYQQFEQELKQHEMFDRMIDIDQQHVMYVFSMTTEYQKIFKQFINGDYSKFPEKYKKKILNFIINPTDEIDIEETITYGILYKTEKQRNKIQELVGSNVTITDSMEVYSSPNEEEEIYSGDIDLPKGAIETASEEEQS